MTAYSSQTPEISKLFHKSKIALQLFTALSLSLILWLGQATSAAAAIPARIQFAWTYDTTLQGLMGYTIFQDNQPIVNIPDPYTLSIELDVFLEVGAQNTFIITAYDNLGNESTPSPAYIVDVPPPDESGNIPPIGYIEISTVSGPAPLTVDVSASTSFDYDGLIVSYSWNFGDGSVSNYENDFHTYETAGTYIVVLTVIDDDGLLSTAETTVIVTDPEVIPNQPPSPLIYTTTNIGPAPLDVLFDGTDSTDPDGSIIDYTWDFGDGSSGSGIFVNYTYSAIGTFTGQLTVTDDAGASATDQTVITVEASDPLNDPPVAVINASPLEGAAPLTTVFSANDSTDPDGAILSYVWDFGDGSIASGTDISHQYLTAGTYTATLTVTDEMGDTGQAQIVVSVSEQTPSSTVVYSDDFNADTSASYSNISGALSVLNGTAHGAEWQITFAHHNLSLGTSDHWIEADVTYNGLSSSAGLIARVDPGARTGYAAYFSAGKINLNRFAGTSQSWLASVAGPYDEGTYSMRMVVTGSTIQVYVDGILKIQKTDITYPDGLYAGVRIHRGSDNADVTADNLIAGIGPPPPFPQQNTAPVAQNTSFTTQEDSAVSGSFIVSDLDGDPLTTSIVSDGTLGAVTITNMLTGTYTYTPNSNVSGTDSFTYKANDGITDSNVATINVTINPVNDLPVAADDSVSTNEDMPMSGSLMAADIEGDKLTYSLVANGTLGTAVISDPSTGAFTYTPLPNTSGTDSFTFKANDGMADSNIATITVSIAPVNDLPVAANAAVSTDEDLVVSGTLKATDIEGDTLTYSLVANGSLGTAVISDPITGAFSYTPLAGTSGTDSFTFKANDGTADSNIATITVTINKVVSATGINDDFSSDTSAQYTTISGAMTIFAGKAHGEVWTETRVYHNSAVDSVDQFVEADVYYSGSVQGAGLLIRVDSSKGTGYLGYFEGEKLNLAAISGTTKQWVAKYNGKYTEGTYRLRMETEGSTIRIYVNGDLVLQKEDSTYIAGKHVGVRFNQGSSTADMHLDNLSGGMLSAPPPVQEPLPPTSIIDDFNTATSSNYTAISGFLTVADGRAHGQQWAETRVFHTGAFASDNQFIEADVHYSGAAQGAGLLIRVDPTQATGYLAYFESGRLHLASIAGTTKQWLGQYNGSYTEGTYHLRMEAQGSTMTISVNGVPVLTMEDSRYPSGKHIGLRFNQGSSTVDMHLDNLSAGIL